MGYWPTPAPTTYSWTNPIDGVVVGTTQILPAVAGRAIVTTWNAADNAFIPSTDCIKATIVVCDNNGGGVFNFLPQAQHTDVFEEIFATPLGLDFAQVARLYGLVYSPVTDRSGLEPAITDALSAQTSTMVVVRYKREDSVNGHRVCWEAAASALRA